MIETFVNTISIDTDKEYVILDVGSRDCKQSIEFYNRFPNSRIYAFECNPNTLPICRKNIEKYRDRITLIEGAVADYDGEIMFYPIDQQKTKTSWEDGNPGASSLFKSNGSYTAEHYVQNEIKTNCHRLDTVLKQHGVNSVDIIWMDLQGAELMAFQGLGDFINAVNYIHTEVCHRPIYSGQALFKDIHEYLTSKGMKLKKNLALSGWFEDAIYGNENITQ